LFENAIQMRGGAAGPDLADRFRVASAQARIAPDVGSGLALQWML
jgi:hypothetical protein